MIEDRLLWAAWIGRAYPGVTPGNIGELSVGQLVDLDDQLRAEAQDG